MGSIPGKSLVFRAVERFSDDHRGHLRSRGRRREPGRRPRRVATALEEAKYGRATAGHRGVGCALGTQPANEPRDFRMMRLDRRLKIVDQHLFQRTYPTRETQPNQPTRPT